MTSLFRAAGLLALGLLLAAPALAQPGEGPFLLKSMYAGEAQCLESNDPSNSGDHLGSIYMTDCAYVSGQRWYIEQQANGYVRLRSQYRGADECLESNDPQNSTGHGGAAYMDACQDVTGQYWEIEPTRDQFGYVRLKTLYLGEDRCLESSRMQDSPASGPGSRMDACQDVSGQYWMLVPTSR